MLIHFKDLEDFHQLLNPDELRHYFGVSHHERVKPESYQVDYTRNKYSETQKFI